MNISDILYFQAIVSVIPREVISEGEIEVLKNGPICKERDHSLIFLHGGYVYLVKDIGPVGGRDVQHR